MAPVTGTRIFTTGMNFFMKNFMALLGATALPILIILIASTGMNWIDVQRTLNVMRQPEAMETLPPALYFVLLALLLIAQFWMLVRLYRFRLKSEFPVTSSEAAATIWVFAYVLALVFIFIVAPIVAAAAAIIVSGADTQTLSANGWFIAAAIVIGLCAMVALGFALTRFSVALPGVAIGKRPAIFGGMWTMGRGVTWALLGWSLLLAIAAGSIAGMLMMAALTAVLPGLMATPDPSHWAELAGQYIWWIMAAGVVLQLPSLLCNAALSVVFAEAYAQLNRPPVS